jgi:uncharacterized protein YggE
MSDRPRRPLPRTITVSGTGRVSVAPDVADLRLGVTTTEPTVESARSGNAAAMSRVLAALRAAGIEARDIQTSNLSLSPAYDYSGPTPRLTGHTLQNTVAVTIRDLAGVGRAIDGALEAGATTVDSITIRVEDPAPHEQAARTLAVADARSKAEVLAAAAGVAIAGVGSISELGGPIPFAGREMAKLAMADAATPVEAGTNEISITVAVTFLIE